MPDDPVELGALDLCTLRDGVAPGRVLHESLALAERLDELGYSRYWIAEHHTPDVAQASPQIMLPLVAARTRRIRVGTGGVLLPLYRPLRVANDFRLMEALFPGRIELGIGHGSADFDAYSQKVSDLLAFLADQHEVRAIPAGVPSPKVWVLGKSVRSASLAARSGTAYCHSLFLRSSCRDPHVPAKYREEYLPSASQPEPEVCIAVAGICAESAAAADHWSACHQHPFVLDIAGTPEECCDQIGALGAKYGTRQILFLDVCSQPEARLYSYESLATEVLSSRRRESSYPRKDQACRRL